MYAIAAYLLYYLAYLVKLQGRIADEGEGNTYLTPSLNPEDSLFPVIESSRIQFSLSTIHRKYRTP